jgi:DNA-directed RNA polymerase subunit RPC12/RpoP
MENTITITDALTIAKTQGLESANSALGGFGIEYVGFRGRELAYVNMGETYSQTVCLEGEDSFFVGSWGDWLENAEAEYCEDTDTIRCGYCGEFTPMDCEDWRDVVCESCGYRLG